MPEGRRAPGVISADVALEAVRRVVESADDEPAPLPAIDVSRITLSTRFDELGLNSVQLAEVFLELEESAGVELDPDSVEQIDCVGDLLAVRAAAPDGAPR